LQGQYFIHADGETCIVPVHPCKVTPDDFLVTLKELQRFEAEAAKQPETPESSATTSDTTNTQTAIETDKELCDRLKLEGLNNKAIAKELKREFPQIRPARIGRLITEVPGVYVEYETYRGRGRQLLK